MAEVIQRGRKHWKKEKLLVMSNFSFSHSVFKRLVSQVHQKVSLCGNGLNNVNIWSIYPQHFNTIAAKVGEVPNTKVPIFCIVWAYIPIDGETDRLIPPKTLIFFIIKNFITRVTFNLLSANGFNLDQSKILLSDIALASVIILLCSTMTAKSNSC